MVKYVLRFTKYSDDQLDAIYTDKRAYINGQRFSEQFKEWNYELLRYIRPSTFFCAKCGGYMSLGKIGELYYHIYDVSGTNVVVIDKFYFRWVPFASNTSKTSNNIREIGNAGYGFSIVQDLNLQKLAIKKPNNQMLTKFIFDSIIGFHHSFEDYNSLHAIGFIGDRVYSIFMNGKLLLLHISKKDYLSMKHRYDERFRLSDKKTLLENNNTKTQNNMKRKIRLTESQLHSMISESVKQVLSELDWKTYDSAMRKSAKRGEWNRAGKFGDASVQAFNRDFGSNESPYDYNYSRANVPFRTKYKGEDKDGNEIWDGTQSNYGFYDDGVYACSDSNYPGVHEVIPTGSRQWQHRRTPDGKVHTSMKDIDKYTDNDDYNKRDNEYDYWYNRSGEDPTRAKAMQKARKGAKETMNYLNGKYDYEPNGRGWHLK